MSKTFTGWDEKGRKVTLEVEPSIWEDYIVVAFTDSAGLTCNGPEDPFCTHAVVAAAGEDGPCCDAVVDYEEEILDLRRTPESVEVTVPDALPEVKAS